MGVDLKKMGRKRKESRDRHGGGSGIFKFPEARTAFYLCPPTPAMDEVPFLEVDLHYGVGPDGRMHVCLDAEANAILNDSALQAALKAAKKTLDLSLPCGTCQRVDGTKPIEGKLSSSEIEEKIERMEAGTSYPMLIIPWANVRGKAKRDEFPDSERRPRIVMAGYKIWDGTCEVIEVEGDVTDPDEAILLICKREGTGPRSTKYEVSADSVTIRSPLRIGKSHRAMVRKSQEEGGDGDLYRLIANMIKTHEQVEGMHRGESVERKDAPADEGTPHCYELDCDPADVECQECPFKEPCAEACEVDVPPDPKGKGKTTTKAEAKGKSKPEPEAEPEKDADGDEVEELLDGRAKKVIEAIGEVEDAVLIAAAIEAEQAEDEREKVLDALRSRLEELAPEPEKGTGLTPEEIEEEADALLDGRASKVAAAIGDVEVAEVAEVVRAALVIEEGEDNRSKVVDALTARLEALSAEEPDPEPEAEPEIEEGVAEAAEELLDGRAKKVAEAVAEVESVAVLRFALAAEKDEDEREKVITAIEARLAELADDPDPDDGKPDEEIAALLKGRIRDDVKPRIAKSEDTELLAEALDVEEKAEKPRRGIVKALKDRIAELTSGNPAPAPEPEADPEAGSGGDDDDEGASADELDAFEKELAKRRSKRGK